MNKVLAFALALSTALAQVASAQSGVRATNKQNPNSAANARAQAGSSLTLTNNPVTRAYHKVAAAIGFGDSQPEKVVTPTPRRTVAANNQKAQSTSRPVSSPSANPNASRAETPTSGTKAATANPAANSKAAATPPTPLKPLASAPAAASPAADTAPHVLINREVFTYEGAGRRDPFVSLLTTSDLKPLLQDLKLTGVAYDPRGQNSVAVLRDVTSKEQYKVRVGQVLGRMRVAAIQPKAVIFTIEEFGYSRQELLPIAPPDSTKMRQRQ
ncbi:MAG TPA: hypothetical protein VJ840_01395 [Gemmatimonadaceae bacterium]|nr:hypothetical protein [Gemmatimonadaceae bacterium]